MLFDLRPSCHKSTSGLATEAYRVRLLVKSRSLAVSVARTKLVEMCSTLKTSAILTEPFYMKCKAMILFVICTLELLKKDNVL